MDLENPIDEFCGFCDVLIFFINIEDFQLNMWYYRIFYGHYLVFYLIIWNFKFLLMHFVDFVMF
jgi:hypothetical protein